ncbi:MAG TPA: 7TM diverse intracellular signaling domain-containing protein [Cytophagaceae bacterium]|nr:7TM diverse intracellular signaling domain-containing protein [Cytophagaceae bacterium]
MRIADIQKGRRTIISGIARLIFAALWLLFFSNHALGEKIVELHDQQDDYVLNGAYIAVFEDPAHQYNILQISAPAFKGFEENGKAGFNRIPQATYWLRFRVRNHTHELKRFLLESYSPHSNRIQVYLPTSNGRFEVQQGGEDFKFDQRIYVTKNLVFDLPLDAHQEVTTFYVRIDSRNYSAFDFRIKTINYFLYYITNEYYFLGLYYGILLIMAVYNLLVYFTVKENVYLYYVFYVFGSAILTMTDDGLGFQYLWPSLPSLSRPIGYTLAPLALMLMFVLYASSFLDLKIRFPKLWRVLLFTTAFYLFYFTISLAFTGKALPILYTIPFLITYGIAWLCYVKGYEASRFFILGYTFILISIMIIQLRAEHMIEGNFFTVYSLNIGLMLEVVIFSFALSDRIRLIKKEKALAQQAIIESLKVNRELQEKVNRELEEKVAARTRELSDKNLELEEVNDKLHTLNNAVNEMNAKLDYDNWYLKKDLKQDIQSRILEAEVPYEEFIKVFPDDLSCLRYLAEQKWQHFYRCRKCGNLKYSESPDGTKRKCTVCGFVESATAYTLYHGVRFPLNKAFYLTYLFYKKANRRNLSDLSEMLQIRRNTCGKFRAKVNESREQYNLRNKNKKPETWEELISVRLVQKKL